MRVFSTRILRVSLFITAIYSLLLSTSVFSSPWKDSNFVSNSHDRATTSLSSKPQDEPLKYRSLELDEYALKEMMSNKTSSNSVNSLVDDSAGNINERNLSERKIAEQPLILPLPDGSEVSVIITETSVLAPELALQFPTIKTWKVSSTNQKISGRVDFTLLGFHAMLVMPNGDTVFIEPDENKQAERVMSGSARYISFSKHENHQHFKTDFKCEVHAKSVVSQYMNDIPQSSAKNMQARPALSLLTYRLAVAATGEYTNYHGGSKAATLSAITSIINRVNEIFERDLSISFQLVPQQLNFIYTNAETDPYTNTDINALLEQNIVNLNKSSVLGSANYDIGHVFGSGRVGGLAFVGSTCNSDYKAGGATGSSNPIGDGFSLDYVAHEIGHQMGAQHTFNSANCGERGVGTAVEPGSGSTIMSYAGLCDDNNLQNEVDAQFHIASIEEMRKFSREGSGNSCGSSSAVTNEAPIVSAGEDFHVPARTPIALIASGSDLDGDTLSYAWEQTDSGSASDVDVDTGDNALFRSRSLSSSYLRFIPQLSDIFNGSASKGEHLPVTNRNMELRVTARDGKGGVTNDAVIMTVHDTGSAFSVTSHTAAKTYGQGDQTTVKWDVAGTHSSPISCANVDIGLIALNGTGIDIVTTSNDGSEVITIPADSRAFNSARFIVSCATSTTNTFFGLSSANLKILDSNGTGENDTETSSGGGGFFGYMILLLLPLLFRRKIVWKNTGVQGQGIK